MYTLLPANHKPWDYRGISSYRLWLPGKLFMKNSPTHRWHTVFSLNTSRKESLRVSLMGATSISNPSTMIVLGSWPQLSVAEKRAKSPISHRDKCPPTSQSPKPVSYCGWTLILHMGLSACSDFSDTYPLKYQRLISKSIPRRKVFDGVTVQNFSLAG